MKRVAGIILVFIVACCSLRAQYNVFNVGARFGGNGYLIKSTDINLKSEFGIQTMLDLSYSYLGELDMYAYLGFKIGASVGWNQNLFESKYENNFVNYDYLGKQMDYTIKTDNVLQKINQFQVELPVMLAFRYAGVTANLGVKCMFPFNATYTQSLNGLNVLAYYPEYDVTVSNEVITGLASDEQFYKSGKMNVPSINLMGSLEFGYEFELGRDETHAVGVMAYLDYCFWNNYSGQQGTTEGMITVSPISDPLDPVPTVNVDVLSTSSIYAMNYFDVGVKVYYRFQAEAGGYYGGRGGHYHRYAHGHR